MINLKKLWNSSTDKVRRQECPPSSSTVPASSSKSHADVPRCGLIFHYVSLLQSSSEIRKRWQTFQGMPREQQGEKKKNQPKTPSISSSQIGSAGFFQRIKCFTGFRPSQSCINYFRPLGLVLHQHFVNWYPSGLKKSYKSSEICVLSALLRKKKKKIECCVAQSPGGSIAVIWAEISLYLYYTPCLIQDVAWFS